MTRLFDSLLSAIERKEPVALGIISGVKGSSPQKHGAKALFFEDGRIEGTLGGGCLEAEIRERARLALMKQQPSAFELVLDHDFGWDDGLVCGGKVCGLILPNPSPADGLWQEIAERRQICTWGVRQNFAIVRCEETNSSDDWLYLETVSPQCELWIAGAGHIARGITPLAQRLDFKVTVFDDRPALANTRYFPEETNLKVDDWQKLLGGPMPEAPAFGLIVTRGHQHDALVLRQWVRRPFEFLGMIGSRRKKRLIFSQFLEDELATTEELDRVVCPVGLEIQAVSVDEIAVSVMAQLIQRRAALARIR